MANGDLLWYDQVANLDLFWPGGPRLHGLSAEIQADGMVLILPGDEPHCEIGSDHATWQLEERGLHAVWRWRSADRLRSGLLLRRARRRLRLRLGRWGKSPGRRGYADHRLLCSRGLLLRTRMGCV